MFADLVHSGQNNLILECETVSGDRNVIMPMVM